MLQRSRAPAPLPRWPRTASCWTGRRARRHRPPRRRPDPERWSKARLPRSRLRASRRRGRWCGRGRRPGWCRGRRWRRTDSPPAADSPAAQAARSGPRRWWRWRRCRWKRRRRWWRHRAPAKRARCPPGSGRPRRRGGRRPCSRPTPPRTMASGRRTSAAGRPRPAGTRRRSDPARGPARSRPAWRLHKRCRISLVPHVSTISMPQITAYFPVPAGVKTMDIYPPACVVLKVLTSAFK